MPAVVIGLGLTLAAGLTLAIAAGVRSVWRAWRVWRHESACWYLQREDDWIRQEQLREDYLAGCV